MVFSDGHKLGPKKLIESPNPPFVVDGNLHGFAFRIEKVRLIELSSKELFDALL